MAVLSLQWLVAASAWLPAVAAAVGPEREQPSPWGAIQTPGPNFNVKEAEVHVVPRVVTAGPAARGVLAKRATNTCGYVDGDPESAYVCANSQAECLYNTVASAVGCCLTTDCKIYTACLPYVSSDARATMDKERTRYCSNSNFPSCAALVYADSTGTMSGYTIPTCDTVATTYSFYLRSSGATAGRSSTSRRTTRTSTTSSRATSSDSPESSDSGEGDDSASSTSDTKTSKTQGPAEATTTGAADPPAEKSSSTPVGPIVGGVVGGVAALGLIGLGIFFLIRHKNQTAPESPPAPAMAAAAPPPAGPGFMPPPGQGPYPNQAPNMSPMSGATAVPPYDPRYSMMKPAMATTVSPMQGQPISPMGVSPDNSPPPQMYHPGMQPGMAMAAVPPHQGMAMGTPPPMMGMAPTPSPPPPQPYVPPPQSYHPPQAQYQAYHPQPTELPTQRGDGQAYELS